MNKLLQFLILLPFALIGLGMALWIVFGTIWYMLTGGILG